MSERSETQKGSPEREPQPEPQAQVTYEESESGFRYRLLDVTVDDGYDAAAAQLLPGEMLYRMMEGVLRAEGRLYPVLMNDEVNFAQSVQAMKTLGWRFKLAAGVPAHSSDEAPVRLAHAFRHRG